VFFENMESQYYAKAIYISELFQNADHMLTIIPLFYSNEPLDKEYIKEIVGYLEEFIQFRAEMLNSNALEEQARKPTAEEKAELDVADSSKAGGNVTIDSTTEFSEDPFGSSASASSDVTGVSSDIAGNIS
jgi:hypothetical protein